MISKHKFYLMWIMAVIVLTTMGACKTFQETIKHTNIPFTSVIFEGTKIGMTKNQIMATQRGNLIKNKRYMLEYFIFEKNKKITYFFDNTYTYVNKIFHTTILDDPSSKFEYYRKEFNILYGKPYKINSNEVIWYYDNVVITLTSHHNTLNKSTLGINFAENKIDKHDLKAIQRNKASTGYKIEADATQVANQSQQEIDIGIISDIENKLIGYYKETPLTMDLAFQLKEDATKLLNMEDRLKSERLTRVILNAESLMRYMVITMMNKDMIDQGFSTTIAVKGLDNKIIVYTNPTFLQETIFDWANTNLIFAKAFHFDKIVLTNGYKTWTFKVKK